MNKYYKLFLFICFVLIIPNYTDAFLAPMASEGEDYRMPQPTCKSSIVDSAILYEIVEQNQRATVYPILYTWSGDFIGSGENLKTAMVSHTTEGNYTAVVEIKYDWYKYGYNYEPKKITCSAVMCIPKWGCFNWSECINNQQSRNCIDLNKCKNVGYKTESQSCEISVSEPEPLVCNDGYVIRNNACITYTQDCINNFGLNVYGLKGDNSNSSCFCSDGYQWNLTKTACVKIEKINLPIVAPEPVSQNVAKKDKKQDTKIIETEKEKNVEKKQETELKPAQQENENNLEESLKEEKFHEPFISWSKIFSPVKNLWNWLFKK